MKKFYIASDHAGFEMKQALIEYLKSKGCDVADMGPADASRVDYPDYARKVATEVVKDAEASGILVCGTGIGISIAANKVAGVRAALCHDAYTAGMARAHNNANVLCMGARVVGLGVAESMIDAWLSTAFEGGRHADRVNKIESCGVFL
ncbi:MAG: ribose 5-phosphate isomerase B [Campylobacterales bacterium]